MTGETVIGLSSPPPTHWARACEENHPAPLISFLTFLCPSPPRWLAPEVLREGRQSRASDVFSFAIIMWEMLTWQIPYTGYFSLQASVMMKCGEYSVDVSHKQAWQNHMNGNCRPRSKRDMAMYSPGHTPCSHTFCPSSGDVQPHPR